jgi:hypothetical protein
MDNFPRRSLKAGALPAGRVLRSAERRVFAFSISLLDKFLNRSNQLSAISRHAPALAES